MKRLSNSVWIEQTYTNFDVQYHKDTSYVRKKNIIYFEPMVYWSHLFSSQKPVLKLSEILSQLLNIHY